MTDTRTDEIRERLQRSREALAGDERHDGLAQAILDISYLLQRIEELEREVESRVKPTGSIMPPRGTPVGELMGKHCLSRERKP